MVKLLGKTLGKQQKNANGAHETVAPLEEQPRDRILVLVPGEGGFAFRLLAFPSVEHAASYGFEHFPRRVHQLFSFRPHHERPPEAPGAPGPVEAIVMVRDEDRHGTVHLYSFVDMETAQAFVRAEGMRGLNLNLVLVFWSEPVALYNLTPEALPAPQELSGPPPPVLTQWQQTRNPLFDSLTPEGEAPPVSADNVPEPSASDPQYPAMPPSPPLAPFVPAAASPPLVDVAPAAPYVPSPASQPPVNVAPPARPQPASAPTGTSFTTQAKEPRRWNAAEDFAAPAQPAPGPKAPSDPGDRGRIGAFIYRIRSWPGWDGFGPVISGAALLRWQTYDEVRKDPYATGRAWVLVGTAVGASAMAGALSGPMAFFFFGLFAAIGAAVYAGCIYIVATQLFAGRIERDDTRLFFQRLALAAAPGPLLLLGIIPIYGPLFTICILIWIGATSIKAVEIGMEMERQAAAYTVVICWLALFAIALVLPSLAV